MVTRTGKMREHKDNCTEVHDLSSDLIDGDLDPNTTGRLSSHLDVCPPCTAFFNTLRHTVRLIGASRSQRKMPPSALARLRVRLAQARGPQ
ncbi:MAG: hypothetical protein FJ319_01450 [SAR202 cluster bacterium]|nr:hypothetical protein [SAR202 cluster bacterium]